MIEPTRIRVAVALICLACASTVSAQQIETQVTDNPQIRKASCAEVAWQKELLLQYPMITEACQEVVISDGEKWARFTGEFVERHDDGSIRTTIDDRHGKSLGQFNLMPAPDQRVLIDGQRVRFSQLKPGQELNFYVPESRYALATEPGAPAFVLGTLRVDFDRHQVFVIALGNDIERGVALLQRQVVNLASGGFQGKLGEFQEGELPNSRRR